MKVLVCGGRAYSSGAQLYFVLDKLHAATPFTLLCHGGASGADTLAGYWARDRGVPVEVHAADWKRYGRAAGPMRNAEMLKKCEPDLVVAFPGGSGTADMLRRATKAGVTIQEVAP